MKTKTAALGFVVTLLAACGDEAGDGGEGTQPLRTEPVVATDSPRCLNQRPFPIAGVVQQYGAVITNLGAEALTVSDARIVEETRDGAFTITGMADPEGKPCSPDSPCRIEFREDVLMAIELEPPSAGWDRALVEIETNDPDYMQSPFTFAIVSAAESTQGAEDFGERPSELACVCRTPVPPECSN